MSTKTKGDTDGTVDVLGRSYRVVRPRGSMAEVLESVDDGRGGATVVMERREADQHQRRAQAEQARQFELEAQERRREELFAAAERVEILGETWVRVPWDDSGRTLVDEGTRRKLFSEQTVRGWAAERQADEQLQAQRRELAQRTDLTSQDQRIAALEAQLQAALAARPNPKK